MPQFPFAFARDNQVLLHGDRLLCGPGATVMGLREARRRALGPVTPERLDQDSYESALEACYRSDSTAKADPLVFEPTTPATGGGAAPRDLLETAADAPVVALVDHLLRQTIAEGSSDLHIEPQEDGLRARIRVDGLLRPVMDRPDVPARRVAARFKVMAGLDTAETRLPQDGRIGLRYGGREIDIRVATQPSPLGERVVLRILDRRAGLRPLDQLGLSQKQEAFLRRLATQPDGILLTTGPTGSGKTTTLYSLLQLADRSKRNIVTVEDPVEYHLDGVNQTQINAEIGLTFAAGLRATLRQDPDIILVGEIRDAETAHIAAQAALTGHLVLSSLHANSPRAAITRLTELGVDPPLTDATLRGVLAQRLVRRLCPECARPTALTDALAQAMADRQVQEPAQIMESAGCPACSGTGYAGRLGLFEVVDRTGATNADQAVDGDLQTQALRHLAAGTTSAAEMARVLGPL